MRKGIIFTADAVLALILVILLASWLPQQIYAGEEYGGGFESLAARAGDKAIMGMYNGQIGNGIISSGAKLGKCAVYYTLRPNNNLAGRDSPIKESFCEEVQ